jgi:DNA polymerase I-like protein with 3'-5' exonuclease and polymerase domains/uracil-DNA glycosylase
VKKPRLVDELPNGPKCGDCPYRPWSRGYTEPQLKPEALLAVVGEASGYWEILEGVPFAGMSGGALNANLALADMTRLDCSILNPVRCRPIKWVSCTTCCSTPSVALDELWTSPGPGYILAGMTTEDVGGIIFEEPVVETCPECAGAGQVPFMQGDGDHANATPEPGQIIECMKRYGHEALQSLPKKRLILGLGASALFALTGKDNIGDQRGHIVETVHGPALMTYHPAFLLRGVAEMEPAVQRDYARIPAIIAGVEGLGFKVEYHPHPTQEQLNELFAARSAVVDIENPGGVLVTAAASLRPGHGIIALPGDELQRTMAGLDEVVGQYFYAHDAWYLARDGYPIPERIVDTQVLGHLANPNSPHDLGFLNSMYADPPMPGYWKEREHYEGDLELVACKDVDVTARVERGLYRHLQRTGQWELADHTIIPWCRLAFELRRDGARMDTEWLAGEGERLACEVERRGRDLAESSGVPLPKKSKTGIPSPQSIKKHLYGTLGLPPQYHRKTGKLTGDELHLKKLRSWCWKNGHREGLAFIDTIIGRPDPDDPAEWQDGLKQDSTRVKDYRKYAKLGADAGSPIVRVHAFVNLTGTETGRLSYSEPNLQQMAKHTRVAVLPEEGHVFLEADYKQVQFLIMLYEAREWDLLGRAINQGMDFHIMTASDFFNVPYDRVTSEQKKAIKPISLGRLFGKGVKTTAEDLEMSEAEVKDLFEGYNKMIPGLAKFQARELASIVSRGYIQTEYGWRRYFPREERANPHYKSVATEAYNLRIQSNEAMVVREAILAMRHELALHFPHEEARLVMMLHDSVVISCLPERAEKVGAMMFELMTAPARKMPCSEIGMPDGVRFPIDLKVGRTWGTMVKWDKRGEVL